MKDYNNQTHKQNRFSIVNSIDKTNENVKQCKYIFLNKNNNKIRVQVRKINSAGSHHESSRIQNFSDLNSWLL